MDAITRALSGGRRMKKVVFTINNHADRMALVEALIENGYEVSIKKRTEYMLPKMTIEVYVEDHEVEEA